MAGQKKFPESWRTITGGALVGLGLHTLFLNLDRDAAHFRHSLFAAGEGTLGVLPSVVLAASRAVKAYGLDHRGFVLGLLGMLISFWPLLLVIAGTIFLRDAVAGKDETAPASAKYFQNKDSQCRFHCPSFDA